eukprot:8129995-Lingulodinium_polyedra.AAC.1
MVAAKRGWPAWPSAGRRPSHGEGRARQFGAVFARPGASMTSFAPKELREAMGANVGSWIRKSMLAQARA